MTMPRIDFHLCDCMDFMRTKPDGFYDLAIVDPPYGGGGRDDNPFWAAQAASAEGSTGTAQGSGGTPLIRTSRTGGRFARYECCKDTLITNQKIYTIPPV